MSGTLMRPEVTEQTVAPAVEARHEEAPYRALSMLAVGSAVVGLMSVLAVAAPIMLAVPALSVVLGVLALRSIARFPKELTGVGAAMFGIIVSVAIGASAIVWHVYDYVTEVPPGYVRVPFSTLQADRDGGPPPEDALQLNHQPIFVKGYIHPDAGLKPVNQFVLVPDMGTCCFGGQPELTDMIQVSLPPGETVRYSTRHMELAGVLSVDPALTPLKGYIGVYYKMDVNYVNGKLVREPEEEPEP